MSDEGGTENLWRLALDGGRARSRSRSSPTAGCCSLAIGYDGKPIVFEREFEIWKLDTATGAAAKVPISPARRPRRAGERRLVETTFRGMSRRRPTARSWPSSPTARCSPPSTKDGGARPSASPTPPAPRATSAWSPDSRRLAYVSERGRASQRRWSTTSPRARSALTDRQRLRRGCPDLLARRQDARLRPRHAATAGDRRWAHGRTGRDTVIYEGRPWPQRRARDSPGRRESCWLAFAVTDRKLVPQRLRRPGRGRRGRRSDLPGQRPDAATTSPGRPTAIHGVRHRPAQRADPDASAWTCCPTRPSTARTPSATCSSRPRAGTPAPTDARPRARPPAKPAASEGRRRRRGRGHEPAPAKPARPPPSASSSRASASGPPSSRWAARPSEPVISPDGKTLVYRARQGDQQNLFSYSLDELAKAAAGPLQPHRRTPQARLRASARTQADLLPGRRPRSARRRSEAPSPRFIDVTGEMVVRFDAEQGGVRPGLVAPLNRAFYDEKYPRPGLDGPARAGSSPSPRGPDAATSCAG